MLAEWSQHSDLLCFCFYEASQEPASSHILRQGFPAVDDGLARGPVAKQLCNPLLVLSSEPCLPYANSSQAVLFTCNMSCDTLILLWACRCR